MERKLVIIFNVILLWSLVLAFSTPQVKSSQASSATGWSQTYGGTGEEQAYFVNQTADGGYVLAGFTDSFGAGNYDFWLVKTDEAGVVTEFPSFFMVPLLATFTLFVIVFAKKKLQTKPK